jgi:dTDP-4-dehydrorhamnose reductase
MHILAGSNSVLSNHILPAIRAYVQVCAFDSDRGDIQDHDFMKNLISEMKPDVFINCCQFDNIEDCEYKRDLTYSINSSAAGAIARLCRDNNIFLIHISSSYIFDGNKNIPYKEGDLPNPIQAYGDSKLLAEKLIMESGCRYLILRVPDIFGRGPSFLQNIFSRIKTDKCIRVIKDQMITPTYAHDAAMGLKELIDRGCEGIFHFANDGIVSMREFIETAVRLYGIDANMNMECEIIEVNYDEYISPVDRPVYNILSAEKFMKITGSHLRDWKSALDDFMKGYHQDL